jgi:hypothetical protein
MVVRVRASTIVLAISAPIHLCLMVLRVYALVARPLRVSRLLLLSTVLRIKVR